MIMAWIAFPQFSSPPGIWICPAERSTCPGAVGPGARSAALVEWPLRARLARAGPRATRHAQTAVLADGLVFDGARDAGAGDSRSKRDSPSTAPAVPRSPIDLALTLAP